MSDYNLSKSTINLGRLKLFLNYEVSASVIYLVWFMHSVFILIYIAAGAAILFTPYLLYVLAKEKRTGWIIFFFTLIIVPLIITIFNIFLGIHADPAVIILFLLLSASHCCKRLG